MYVRRKSALRSRFWIVQVAIRIASVLGIALTIAYMDSMKHAWYAAVIIAAITTVVATTDWILNNKFTDPQVPSHRAKS